MYSNQSGHLQGARRFLINRGVKQGDIISPLLFNSALELAMKSWMAKIGQAGIELDGGRRLTNIRYADDIMVYATSLGELTMMLEMLTVELRIIGLELNQKKTKILTTVPMQQATVVEVAGEFVDILYGQAVHKYLGRKLPGQLSQRGRVELSHRFQNAWWKFNEHRDTLLDQDISVASRLKLFEAVVTPTVLFGLSSCPLTKQQVQSIDALQRRMLRSIVGWRRVSDEHWSETMRRMRDRVDHALHLFPVKNWSTQFYCRKFRFVNSMVRKPEAWPAKAICWSPPLTNPQARRSRGRPPRRWDDDLIAFASVQFPGENWYEVANDTPRWLSHEQAYIDSLS
jgi:hypothetical protein